MLSKTYTIGAYYSIVEAIYGHSKQKGRLFPPCPIALLAVSLSNDQHLPEQFGDGATIVDTANGASDQPGDREDG